MVVHGSQLGGGSPGFGDRLASAFRRAVHLRVKCEFETHPFAELFVYIRVTAYFKEIRDLF